jgi:hypothetical protein
LHQNILTPGSSFSFDTTAVPDHPIHDSQSNQSGAPNPQIVGRYLDTSQDRQVVAHIIIVRPHLRNQISVSRFARGRLSGSEVDQDRFILLVLTIQDHVILVKIHPTCITSTQLEVDNTLPVNINTRVLLRIIPHLVLDIMGTMAVLLDDMVTDLLQFVVIMADILPLQQVNRRVPTMHKISTRRLTPVHPLVDEVLAHKVALLLEAIFRILVGLQTKVLGVGWPQVNEGYHHGQVQQMLQHHQHMKFKLEVNLKPSRKRNMLQESAKILT